MLPLLEQIFQFRSLCIIACAGGSFGGLEGAHGKDGQPNAGTSGRCSTTYPGDPNSQSRHDLHTLCPEVGMGDLLKGPIMGAFLGLGIGQCVDTKWTY